ncbi:hypothetical protein LSM04_004140 [Trypanosoma melophagium]|uniref:uncharacterized protein n=1 Tax=Trypanosoma melophagium TaxID=715481 RepID=UPI00351A4965|nr:hypothetical protein LSM04_004140 [Trypanosoma melophagium]
MSKGKSRKEAVRVRMEDGLNTEQRLQEWGAAAELLYAPYSPVHQPPSNKEPHAFLVARRIATVMARLNELCQREAEVLMTPREALLDLADIIRFGLVSFHREVVLGQLDSTEIAAVLAEYIAQRKAPQAGVIEGLHVIAWVSVKLRVEMFLQQLRMRLKAEIDSCPTDMRSEEQVAALNTTIILLNDFEASYDNLLVTFPCVQLMDSAPEAAEQLMPVLSMQYYQLAQWVELVENSTLQSPNMTNNGKSSTKVQSIDRESSTVTIRRKDLTSPWGLIFNECGRLVGVDIALRSASAEGEELHRLLRCTTEGASVVAINSTEVPDILPDGAQEVLEIIRYNTSEYKRITMKLKSDTFKQLHVRQLAFFLPNQGGEGSSGQRAMIVLHRPDRYMPWGFDFSEDLVVQHIPTHNLSTGAKIFFSEYKGTVVLLAVNGVEVTTPNQAAALCAHPETVVLNLVVLTPAMMGLRRKSTSVGQQETTSAFISPGIETTHTHTNTNTATMTMTTPLVGEKTLTPSGTPTNKKKSRKSNRKKAEVHAEDVDAAVDVAEANEAEELTAEPPQTAEEEDVKETYPAVADEDTAEEPEQKQIVQEQQEKLKLLQEQEQQQQEEEEARERERQLLRLQEEERRQREEQLRQEQEKENERQLLEEQEKKKKEQQKREVEDEKDHPVAEVSDSTSLPEPLVMPNDTTIELLTPSEMIIRRESTDKKWGLTLESIGGGLDRAVRMTGLPSLASKHDLRRRHPFYKTFQKPPVKTEWRIQSVNGTPASKAPELLDIMRRSLIMRIKFFKGR